MPRTLSTAHFGSRGRAIQKRQLPGSFERMLLSFLSQVNQDLGCVGSLKLSIAKYFGLSNLDVQASWQGEVDASASNRTTHHDVRNSAEAIGSLCFRGAESSTVNPLSGLCEERVRKGCIRHGHRHCTATILGSSIPSWSW